MYLLIIVLWGHLLWLLWTVNVHTYLLPLTCIHIAKYKWVSCSYLLWHVSLFGAMLFPLRQYNEIAMLFSLRHLTVCTHLMWFWIQTVLRPNEVSHHESLLWFPPGPHWFIIRWWMFIICTLGLTSYPQRCSKRSVRIGVSFRELATQNITSISEVSLIASMKERGNTYLIYMKLYY